MAPLRALKLLNFDDPDPDPAFHSNTAPDPDPASHNNADLDPQLCLNMRTAISAVRLPVDSDSCCRYSFFLCMLRQIYVPVLLNTIELNSFVAVAVVIEPRTVAEFALTNTASNNYITPHPR
jgi:hypothetical protein